MKASQVNDDIISGNTMRGVGTGSLGVLMEYEHVSTRLLLQESIDDWAGELGEYREVSVEDEVLMKVLVEKGKEKEVSFVFQRSF